MKYMGENSDSKNVIIQFLFVFHIIGEKCLVFVYKIIGWCFPTSNILVMVIYLKTYKDNKVIQTYLPFD